MYKFGKFLSIFAILTVVLALLLSAPLAAKAKAEKSKNSSLAKPSELVSAQFDGNTIACWMQNQGLIVSHKVTGSSGMEWPKGSNKTIDYASGLWLVGKTPSGEVRTASSEYSTEFQPGPILPNGTRSNESDPAYRIYKINSDGTGDWDVWPYDQGAPFVLNANGQKVPQLIGDQTMFWVMNDLDPTAHANVFATAPMGLEQQVLVFGYNTADPLGNIMFVQWKTINKSTTSYDSCFVAVWDDPDMGDASDDLVGCDTTLSLGYCYNGGPVDATYGTTPPAIGFDFFQGPEVPKGSGHYLPMTSFVYYWNGAPDPYGDPEDAAQMYNFMRGFANDGSAYIDDLGQPSKFVFNGDPVSQSGWLDSAPADRRFLMASGPFTLAAGDTQVIVGAKIIAPGTDNLSAVRALRFFDSYAQNAFDNKFNLPKPASPVVKVINLDKKIVLNWQDEKEVYKTIEAYDFSGYKFEGYNVYQGESEAGPWKRINTVDVVDDFGIVFDNSFNAATGLVLEQPVAFGANTGISRNMTVELDAISGLGLNNYKTYYFAVTAYAVNPHVSPKIAESGQIARIALPGSSLLGTQYAAAEGYVTPVTHVTGLSDGSVRPVVVNPNELTGHKYQVTFAPDATGTYLWTLKDLTANKIVLANQANQTNDEDYMIVDGFKLYVAGPPPGLKAGDEGFLWTKGTRRFTWANSDGLHFETFNGAAGWNSPYKYFGDGSGGVPPAKITNIVIKLANADASGVFDPNQANVSYGYRYLRNAQRPAAKPEFQQFIINPGDGSYGFQDFVKTVPLAVYDIDGATPRRLAVGWLENNVEGGLVDGKYWPPDHNTTNNVDAAGPREWLFIFNTDYTETADPNLAINVINNDLPVMYWLTWSRRGNALFTDGDEVTFYANHINSESDLFEFTTAAPKRSAEVGKTQLSKINAVPNPYFGWNPAERVPTTRVLRVTNLPGEKATIRIFDLAGNLVKVIDDQLRQAQGSSGTPYAEWDLRNQSDVPVSSGIYLAHIEIENVGATILKIAVINREERLLYY